jgi:CRP-like cAMP-binding protein
MIIDEKLLKSFGAQLITFAKGDYVFIAHAYPQNYYQIKSGSLKITSDNFGFSEFIHWIAGVGDPVGETFLSTQGHYTVNAVALETITVFALTRASFYELIKDYPESLVKLYQHTCKHINHQQTLVNKLAYSDSRSIIITVIDNLKIDAKKFKRYQYQIPYTRKQLATMTGLRTETVVRTIKQLHSEGFVDIIDGKVFY